MLLSLSLKNFVLVDEMEISFPVGFTVMTGETGAGKSILIDALKLLLGGRGDAGVVRTGKTKADLFGTFSPSSEASAWLAEQDLQNGEDDLLLLHRSIDAQGRSRAWINGMPATVAQLKALGELLVDIHSQNAFLSLARPKLQLHLLDAYAGHGELLKRTAQTYAAWRRDRRMLDQAKADSALVAAKLEELSWKAAELQTLNPAAGEWERLDAEHRRLSHRAALEEKLQRARESLTEGESAAADALGDAYHQIESASQFDSRLSDMMSSLATAIDLVEDASRELSGYLDKIDLDEERFEKLDKRVSDYFRLANRFHVQPEALHAEWTAMQEKIHALQAGNAIPQLEERVRQSEAAFRQEAEALSASRRAAAVRLENAVTKQFGELALKDSRFSVCLESADPSPTGLEACNFLFAGHLGAELRPLSKVASGGELSRVSLAISVVTTQFSPVQTLVFDEVDAGIGGSTALRVGELLKMLASHRQVICITHLPQVAAAGSTHLRIEKLSRDGETFSRIQALSGQARILEISRMLSGSRTDRTQRLAEEMLGVSKN